ncbi:nucleoside diphosphate kinase 7 isoform X2 [Culicoides brevitarsis]|uniref:nucleoside diphosphate kinase 7 isoform X2 n=1 Tax=Culicoides brevitarsis TaxID=469753 RepID=UPI00307C4AF7
MSFGARKVFEEPDRFVFEASWFQNEAQERKLYLYFYPNDSSLELFDLHSRKTFLRRCKLNGISEPDLYLGAKLMIYGRQINVIDYADELTRRKLSAKRQKTFIVVKPAAYQCTGKIITLLYEQKFTVQQLKMVRLNQGLARIILDDIDISGNPAEPFLVEQLLSGPVVMMELSGDDAVSRLINLIGEHGDPDAKLPSRLLFGLDSLRTAVFVSKNLQQAETHIRTFFGDPYAPKVESTENKTTLCLIKAHAIKEGNAGKIIDALFDSDLRITAMKMCLLERQNCEEFYEVYKGVVPEYQMVLQLSSGPCIALEIAGKSDNSNAYSELRGICGPTDPEIAKQIRPHTLRAKFGKNKVENAVHCTDLEEDCQLEVEYFFKIIE